MNSMCFFLHGESEQTYLGTTDPRSATFLCELAICFSCKLDYNSSCKLLSVRILLPKGSSACKAMADRSLVIVHNSILLFERYLTTAWTRAKPRGVNTALLEARSKPSSASSKIFLDASLSAWLAYFLATTGHGYHYKGRKSDRETLAAFEGLPTVDRRKVAAQIVSTNIHSTVASMLPRVGQTYRKVT